MGRVILTRATGILASKLVAVKTVLMKWILGAGAARILACMLFTVCWAVVMERLELARAPGVLASVQLALRRTVRVGGQRGARAARVNVGVECAVGGAVRVKRRLLTRAPGVLASPGLAVRRTVVVSGVS